jgi:hypothetical protein
MDVVDQVRRILATRNLTLYRLSQQSAKLFGGSSRFYVPHKLYSDVALPALAPTLHQMLAISHLTNYRFSDWLAVFGFELDIIPRLGLLAPRRRTTLLDSSVYDTFQWVPWFSERPLAGQALRIAPLGQFLTAAAPRRAKDLLPSSSGRFLYGKVGDEDVHAFPNLAPGSIVRVDTRRREELVSSLPTRVEDRFFFVENHDGFTCSRLVMPSKDTIILHSPNRPYAHIELKLGKEARILGVVDAELRSLTNRFDEKGSPSPASTRKSRSLLLLNPPTDLQGLLRNSRIRAGLSFREASSLSRWIADNLASRVYFAAASTLSDYETLLETPRHVQKVITLCVLYAINFWQFLRASGLPLDQAGRDPIPDELLPRNYPEQSRALSILGREQNPLEQNGFLSALVEQWQEVPLFLRNSLSELTGLKNFSASDLFWVGGNDAPFHPLLSHATFIAVNRRIKKPAEYQPKADRQQPLYLIYKRDGSYLCACCALQDGQLIVPSYTGSPFGTLQFRNGVDAELVGQVTAIVRRFP